jgi:hypothetical protein
MSGGDDDDDVVVVVVVVSALRLCRWRWERHGLDRRRRR